MSVNFPINPSVGQTASSTSGTIWIYNGISWTTYYKVGQQDGDLVIAEGYQGPSGPTGIQGSVGFQGSQGFQGVGSAGSQGFQGFQGYQGTSGGAGATGSPSPDVITLFIDATPDDIQTGKKTQRLIPYDCSISEWYIVSGQTGSIQFDIKKSTFSNYPTTTTIISSGPPLLNNQNKNSNLSVTGWATISSGDMIEIWVDSNTDIQNVSLFLKLE